MTIERRSVPFSVTILTVMAAIVVPLSLALLWLGWRSVKSLERRVADEQMMELDDTVGGFLTNGLRGVVLVGLTLADQPTFAAQAGPAVDRERLRELVAVLRRHPAMTAAYVGYDDGLFLYAGHATALSASRRAAFGAPPGDSIIVRTIKGDGADRRERWSFATTAGIGDARGERPSKYDPRKRPWFVEAERARQPVLTAPYRFAWSGDVGVSAGLPLRTGGVIGFDFTFHVLSTLLVQHKPTTNSVIAVSIGSSDVFVESPPCVGESCFADDQEARKALRRLLAEADGGDRPVQHDIEAGGHAYRLIVHPMPPLIGRPFFVGAAVPVAELSADSRALTEREALLALVAVALAVAAVFAVSMLLSRSLARITAKTERIRQLDFSDTAPVESRISEIRQLSDAVERLREGLQVFGRYVSKDLVTQIMKAPASTGLGGTRRQLTVMFTDIEGFSRISEGIEPELLTSRLSRYFEALGVAISNHHGMIDKYIGDSIMAFWNAPQPDPDHVADACRAALEAAAASRALADKWQSRDRPAFRTRIGLHTGLAVVGNVGARERINYTLVGAVANQASRLEGLNKAYGTEILASAEVAGATEQQFVWRYVDRVVPAGTTEVMEIHEPMGIRPDDRYAAFLERWKQGQGAYRDRRFVEAALHFEQALELRPGDGPCQVLVARSRMLAADGVPANWDGAWRFDRK